MAAKNSASAGFFIVLVLCCFVVPGAHADSVSPSDAAKSMGSGVAALFAAFYHAPVSGPGPFSYSAPGLSASGTFATAGTTKTLTETITLTSYVDSVTGYTVSGTQTLSIVADATSPALSFTGSSTADLTIVGGAVGSMTWNVSISGAGKQQTLIFSGGTVTCDGTSFDAPTLWGALVGGAPAQ